MRGVKVHCQKKKTKGDYTFGGSRLPFFHIFSPNLDVLTANLRFILVADRKKSYIIPGGGWGTPKDYVILWVREGRGLLFIG